MGLEELEEALLRQRQDFAETDLIAIIAKVLEVDRGIVERVVSAYDRVLHLEEAQEKDKLLGRLDYRFELDRTVMTAIKESVELEICRARMADCIARNVPFCMETTQLIKQDYQRICDGCLDKLRCIADNLSTPEKCVARHRSVVPVQVLSLKGPKIRVKADQPKGEFEIDIQRILHWNAPYNPNPFPEKK